MVLLIALACGLAAASYAALVLTDNFYLVDPARHVVYRHTKFGFVRRVRLWLERKDVLGVSTETRFQTRGAGSWRFGDFDQAEPHQRVVLISRLGRLVPFSNWEYDALWPSNNRAAELARQLECAFYEAPDRCRLRVVVANGAASVTFVPFKWWNRFEMSLVYLMTSIAAAGLVAIAYWFSRA